MTRWEAEAGRRGGAIVDLATLWQLSVRWYDDRLDPQWRRRTPAERQQILGEVGLTGSFWRIEP